MTTKQLRFLAALALERVGGLSPDAVCEEAERMLDELSQGDDPLSEMLRSHIQSGPLTPVAISTEGRTNG